MNSFSNQCFNKSESYNMKKSLKYKLYATTLAPAIFLVCILFARNYGGHLLFHSLAESFSILAGPSIL